MRYAVFSDIHSNLEALEAAVEHARGQNIDSWIVLGDTVGYGANPNECFEWALKHADLSILGNHEKAVVDPMLRDWFNAWAREAIVWTDQVMDPGLKKKIQDLPYVHIAGGVSFAHGSLHEPEEFHYLMSYQDALPTFKKMENAVCLVGHTHVPACFCELKRDTFYLKPGIVRLEEKERYILNPGSVGQPRDRDWRLSFGIYDDAERTFEIVRIPYDNHKAADKIRKAGLPVYLAARLL